MVSLGDNEAKSNLKSLALSIIYQKKNILIKLKILVGKFWV